MSNQLIGRRAVICLLAMIVVLVPSFLVVSLQSNNISTANEAAPISEFGYKEYVKEGPFVINISYRSARCCLASIQVRQAF